VLEAACWAHARRKFFVLAEIGLSARRKLAVIAPLAVEAVKRINAIFDQIASRLGPAQPRGVRWKGAGAWLIASQRRHVIGVDMDGALKIGAVRGCDVAVLSELLPGPRRALSRRSGAEAARLKLE
jgi:hypothetical protein